MLTHSFTEKLLDLLDQAYPGKSREILAKSYLLQYINYKTKSANRGSKARGSFASLYAIYVLVEAYLKGGFVAMHTLYRESPGARFTDLLTRARSLPFGAKIQNHALNSRANDEFHKLFPTIEARPIEREVATQRYWINPTLLMVEVDGGDVNIAEPIIKIIDSYIEIKRGAFMKFMEQCREIQKLADEKLEHSREFVEGLLHPNVDARIFEIVSFAILKAYYGEAVVFWGYTRNALNEDQLTLYKTGRTNANDGGIDFVMRPLGRFFQVTETLDVKKYFLDIDKVQRYPITFVVKSRETPNELKAAIEAQARRVYSVEVIVKRYMDCIEEIINIPALMDRFKEVVANGKLNRVLSEIVLQSRVEFNYQDDNEE